MVAAREAAVHVNSPGVRKRREEGIAGRIEEALAIDVGHEWEFSVLLARERQSPAPGLADMAGKRVRR
jgi:hypothetical protein